MEPVLDAIPEARVRTTDAAPRYYLLEGDDVVMWRRSPEGKLKPEFEVLRVTEPPNIEGENG